MWHGQQKARLLTNPLLPLGSIRQHSQNVHLLKSVKSTMALKYTLLLRQDYRTNSKSNFYLICLSAIIINEAFFFNFCITKYHVSICKRLQIKTNGELPPRQLQKATALRTESENSVYQSLLVLAVDVKQTLISRKVCVYPFSFSVVQQFSLMRTQIKRGNMHLSEKHFPVSN